MTGMPVGAAARLIRYSAPGEIVIGERAATATCGAFKLVKRDGGYVLMGMATPPRSPAQSASPAEATSTPAARRYAPAPCG